MDTKIIEGIIYAHFDDKFGPMAVAWTPAELSSQARDLVGLKSINIMMGEGGAVPESLAILPFPSINLKGMSRYFEISDESHRGGAKGNSLTLVFSEANDAIFYKYINNFEALFNETINEITALVTAKVQKSRIQEEIHHLFGKMEALLGELHDIETSPQDLAAFPEERPESIEVEDYSFKIIVCGDPMVGKTSTILRFTDNAFMRTYLPTMGVQISEKKLRLKTGNVSLVIWDLAGQSKYQAARKHFYKGAHGLLLVYDLTRRKTLGNISHWHKDIKKYVKRDLSGLILGNKCDLVDQSSVKHDEILNLSSELGIDYLTTSALTGENVDQAFIQIAERLIEEEKKR